MSFYIKSYPNTDHSDSDSSLKSTLENSDLGYPLGVKNAMETDQESMIDESNSKKNFNLHDFNYLLLMKIMALMTLKLSMMRSGRMKL